MKKRWKLPAVNEEKAVMLQNSLQINPVLCRLLVNRGLENFEACRSFFRPQWKDLHSPWLMKDMDLAVSRILRAVTDKEKILVYGDYDVDGTTSVAIMYEFLLENCFDAGQLDYYLPHRYREGYGVSKKGIDFALDTGVTLIIALDCGIKSIELIGYARQSGVDFIVCDHHLPENTLPPAVAILNPKQSDCPYPYKELCGCGIAFKLITALSERLTIDPSVLHPFLDLVATAIAADIVPMTGENRVMAWFGLQQINASPRPGIRALIELTGFKNEKGLTITNVVFVIAPRVNAAGRMDDARKAVQLFIEKDYQQALLIAAMLHSDNADRREADTSMTREALEIIGMDEVLMARKSTVLYQPHWHKGVVGIVASRLIEKYYRPTVVLTRSGDFVSGSARSVTGFNLYEAIHACREYLVAYGGHFAAAGLTLHPEHVDRFMLKFDEVVTSTILPEMLQPQIIVDAEIAFADIKPAFFRILSQMEPFGPGNMHPVFLCRRVVDNGWTKIIKDKHISFNLRQNDIVLRGIGFNLANKFPVVGCGEPFDILFCLEENEWNNEKSLQLRVIDLKTSDIESD